MRVLTIMVCLVALVLVGCSVQRLAGHNNADETIYTDPDFAYTDLLGRGLAIGGVVLRDGLVLDARSGLDVDADDLTLDDQADRWTPTFEAIVRRKMPEVEVYGWFSQLSVVPDPLRQESLATIASRGHLKPDLLAEYNAHLPHERYLAYVRIENSWPDNTGEGGWSGTSGIGRVVVLTLEIYDMGRGVSVWSHKTQKHVLPSQNSPNKLTESGTNQVRVYVTFEEALDDAMEVAVSKLKDVGKSESTQTGFGEDDEF